MRNLKPEEVPPKQPPTPEVTPHIVPQPQVEELPPQVPQVEEQPKPVITPTTPLRAAVPQVVHSGIVVQPPQQPQVFEQPEQQLLKEEKELEE